MGAVMLIGAKSSCHHCLILWFLHQNNFKIIVNLKISLFCYTLSNLISYFINFQNMKLFH
jgi:hypothetical protein